ncbi:MAG: hypothetical protein OJF58_004961 [Enhydrobacter sp.]|nr:MAG: hypothetical protein OJF58_004961 [Enhydrobacter sp.]
MSSRARRGILDRRQPKIPRCARDDTIPVALSTEALIGASVT